MADSGDDDGDERNQRRNYDGDGGLSDAKMSCCAGLSARTLYALISCSHCQTVFDDQLRVPRALVCGHLCCDVCLGMRIRSTKSASKSKAVRAVNCPICGIDTSIAGDQAAVLAPAHGTVALLRAYQAAGPLPFRVHVRNMAGERQTIIALPEFSIANIRALLHEQNSMYVEHLQRLMRIGVDQTVVFEDVTASLSSLNIHSESELFVVMRDDFGGGRHVENMNFKSVIDPSIQLQCSVGSCVTQDGKHFWISDVCSKCVCVPQFELCASLFTFLSLLSYCICCVCLCAWPVYSLMVI